MNASQNYIVNMPLFKLCCLFVTQDWFEQYRERVIETEQKILTTLDFELEVEHPYVPLASVLNKLGLSQSVLLTVAWNFVSEGYGSWLCYLPIAFAMSTHLFHLEWKV